MQARKRKKEIMNLQERLREQFTNTLPFMVGRTKGKTEDLIGKELTMVDCGLLESPEGQFSCVIFSEYEKEFFFGGSILTEIVKYLVDGDLVDEVQKEGVKVKFTTEKSKQTKRSYTRVEIL